MLMMMCGRATHMICEWWETLFNWIFIGMFPSPILIFLLYQFPVLGVRAIWYRYRVTHTHTHTHTHTYIHTYTHTHTHTYIHIYKNTHTHTQTHIILLSFSLSVYLLLLLRTYYFDIFLSTGYGSDNSKGAPKGGKQPSTYNSDSRSKYRNDGSRYGSYPESGYSSTGSQVRAVRTEYLKKTHPVHEERKKKKRKREELQNWSTERTGRKIPSHLNHAINIFLIFSISLFFSFSLFSSFHHI